MINCHICDKQVYYPNSNHQIYCSDPCKRLGKEAAQRIINQKRLFKAVTEGKICKRCQKKAYEPKMKKHCKKCLEETEGYFYEKKEKVMTNVCKTGGCEALILRSKTYCAECMEVNKEKAMRQQLKKRKEDTAKMKLVEKKPINPMFLVRGTISDNSRASCMAM